jgi:NitT/TauT family transport system ATP-binding protein
LHEVCIAFPASAAGDGPLQAVNNVSLDIAPGEFVSLLGPSGCGKSTLLRAIAGLQPLTSGTVSITHRQNLRRDVAFVFQDANLLPWRNALRNVALPLELMGVPKPHRLAAAREALHRVGLGDALTRYPAQLSGGMRMRCSLARALVTRPRLLLLDEPFAALDEITRQRLDEMLRDLWRETGTTTLFVTHSISEAAYLSDRAIVFSRRPARILLDHRLNLPAERPAQLRTEVRFAAESRTLFDALRIAEGGNP